MYGGGRRTLFIFTVFNKRELTFYPKIIFIINFSKIKTLKISSVKYPNDATIPGREYCSRPLTDEGDRKHLTILLNCNFFH